MSGVIKLANQLSRALNTQARQPRRTRRARRARVPRPRLQGAAMPMAYSTHVRSYFRMRPAPGSRLRVAGCDLVTPIQFDRVFGTTEAVDFRPMRLFSVITANPVYWLGTRVSAIAAAYFNYRPIRMCFHYVPQVPVTVAGTVVAGTLWCGQSPSSDLQQTLVTSNGGIMNQCYVPADSRLALGQNLPQRMFFTQGEFSTDTNPFVWVAMNVGGYTSEAASPKTDQPISTPVTPGYYFVEYEYELANPLGSAAKFDRSAVQLATIPTVGPTSSAVVVQSDTLPLGTVLTRDDTHWMFAGDLATPGDNDYVIAYTQVMESSLPRALTYSTGAIPFQPITSDPTREGHSGFVAYYANAVSNGFRIFLGTPANTVAEIYFPKIGKSLVWAFNQSASVRPTQAGFSVFDFYKLSTETRSRVLQKLGVSSVDQLGTDVQVKAITYQPSNVPPSQAEVASIYEAQPEDNLQALVMPNGQTVPSHPLLPVRSSSVRVFGFSQTDPKGTPDIGNYPVYVPLPEDFDPAFCGVYSAQNALLPETSRIDASGAEYQRLMEIYDATLASSDGRCYLWNNQRVSNTANLFILNLAWLTALNKVLA